MFQHKKIVDINSTNAGREGTCTGLAINIDKLS